MKKDEIKKNDSKSWIKQALFCAISVIAMAVIAWMYFMPEVTDGMILHQNDVVQGVANSHEIAQYEAKTGEKSWWTDALFGGMPTFQISPSYESSGWLKWIQTVYTLGFPQPVSLVFMMMLGFFIFLLACDCKWYLALLGAIAYAFSSYFFIIIHAGHIWKVFTLAYIPPTLAGVVLAYRGKYLAGAALAALFGALQLMSNHFQMTYYSAFIIAALVIGYLVKALMEKQIGRWAVATVALLVAGGLAVAANAPNIYLTQKYSKETMRGGHSELTPEKQDGQPQAAESDAGGGLSKEYITQWSYGVGETATLLVPNAKGGTSEKRLGETSAAEDMDLDQQESYILQQVPQYFGDQPFTSGPVYIGIIIFALFLLGCFVVKGPVKWALLAVTILTVMLSWGKNFMPLTDFFIDHFPMYNKFRTVSSILVVAELTMPLLGILALKEVFTQEDFFKKQYNKVALAVSFGLPLLICLVLALMPGVMGGISAEESKALAQVKDQIPGIMGTIKSVRHSMVRADALRGVLFLVLGLGALSIFLFKPNKRSAIISTLALALLVLVDMYAVNKNYLNADDFEDGESLADLALTEESYDQEIKQDKTLNYRVFDAAGLTSPRSSYFHKTVGGYHAAKLTRYNDLLERQLSKGNIAVINMLNSRHIIMPADDGQGGQQIVHQTNPAALGNAWFVDSLTYVNTADEEMKFLDKFNPATSAVADKKFSKILGQAKPKQDGDTIYETKYAPNRLEFKSHSAAGGLAVFSEIYFPWGWNATIDDKKAEIGRVNYVLRAMQLPAGDHTIVMDFHPQEVTKTDTWAKIAIAAIFLLSLAAIGAAFLRCRKKTPAEK